MRATIATVCLAALSTTSAFVQRAPVKMSAAPKVMSKSLPFKALINNPETGKPVLDGALPGDVGKSFFSFAPFIVSIHLCPFLFIVPKAIPCALPSSALVEALEMLLIIL